MQPKHYPSPNYDDRPEGARIKYLIIHATDGSLEDSLRWLTSENPLGARVSCHYLIAENGDIYALVEENKRAWHAGESSWGEDVGLNATSIGIELVNIQGQPFTPQQMAALEGLAKDIMTRHGIDPAHVLGHSDIAPGRKWDPGPLFDWDGFRKLSVG